MRVELEHGIIVYSSPEKITSHFNPETRFVLEVFRGSPGFRDGFPKRFLGVSGSTVWNRYAAYRVKGIGSLIEGRDAGKSLLVLDAAQELAKLASQLHATCCYSSFQTFRALLEEAGDTRAGDVPGLAHAMFPGRQDASGCLADRGRVES